MIGYLALFRRKETLLFGNSVRQFTLALLFLKVNGGHTVGKGVIFETKYGELRDTIR